MKSKVLDYFKRIIIYLVGLFIIAIGINVSKMAQLGISPVSSVPRALEVWLGFTLGQMVLLVYCLLVFAQFIVLRKNFKPKNILGVAVGIVFGWMVDLVGIDPNAIGHLMYGFPMPDVYWLKLIYLAASIIIIGIGVFTYLKADLIPMPAEGLALAISEKTNLKFGDCKTIVDVSLITLAVIFQCIALGGLSSFLSDTVVVREGTIISAICVGQVVKFIRWVLGKIKTNK